MTLALVAGPLLAEGLLRWLLFSPATLARRLGERYRQAGLYVASPFTDDFAKLSWRFQPAWLHPDRPMHYGDARTGWLKATIDTATYRHAAEAELGSRRPVLLYGSSFAACKPDARCFEELLDDSELGRSLCLLNYAVQGHGLDQTLLLLEHSVDLYAERSPLVVVAFVVEADLDRSTLSFFTRPKPRYRADGDGTFRLELPDELVARVYIERHPPAITSYLWRYLVNGTEVALETRQRWEDEPSRVLDRDAINAFLLRELARACTDRSLEHFVLLFHTREAFATAPGRAELVLRAELERLAVPHLDTRELVERARARRGSTLEDLYEPSGHPTALGTEVLFETLAAGLAGQRDGA